MHSDHRLVQIHGALSKEKKRGEKRKGERGKEEEKQLSKNIYINENKAS